MATKQKIEWPTAAVLCVFLAALAAAYIFVPDHRDEVMAAVTVLGSTFLAFMRPVLPPPPPRPRRERETDAPPPGDA